MPDERRDGKIVQGCEVYVKAPQWAREGERTISLDKLTGVQALERKHPDQPMLPGHTLRREFEYIRHGILSWFINFDVVDFPRHRTFLLTNTYRGGCRGPSQTPDWKLP